MIISNKSRVQRQVTCNARVISGARHIGPLEFFLSRHPFAASWRQVANSFWRDQNNLAWCFCFQPSRNRLWLNLLKAACLQRTKLIRILKLKILRSLTLNLAINEQSAAYFILGVVLVRRWRCGWSEVQIAVPVLINFFAANWLRQRGHCEVFHFLWLLHTRVHVL